MLTNDASEVPCSDPADCESARCRYYLENSFNMAQKGFCDVVRAPHSQHSLPCLPLCLKHPLPPVTPQPTAGPEQR